jgi:hypothetical protein
MAITRQQFIDLGFKPAKRKSPYAKKYDTLIFKINDTDYLYLGYSTILKTTDFKRIWKSVVDMDGNRVTYQISPVGETSFRELKEFIDRHNG